jgi:hypothetical protein
MGHAYATRCVYKYRVQLSWVRVRGPACGDGNGIPHSSRTSHQHHGLGVVVELLQVAQGGRVRWVQPECLLDGCPRVVPSLHRRLHRPAQTLRKQSGAIHVVDKGLDVPKSLLVNDGDGWREQ